ncbi:MAG: glycosyltransferase family 4 protein [Nocardioidaceae bacterium]|nr:glycosyltransferase family 4 protein [Nocardioidaceae bacterium]
MRVHLLVPAGFATRPTGGNVYDRHLRAGLLARGWEVVVHEVADASELRVPDDAPVLVDSLVASWAAGALLDEPVVPLVHMLFGVPGERALLAQAPAVLTTSAWTRRQVLADRAVDPRRVHVALPGTELGRLVVGRAGGTELLCAATLTEAKGQDVLLAALARLGDLDWHCTLAGSLEADPEFVDRLRKIAADEGILDRVRFAGETDPVPYPEADLVVLPTRAESYGMVVTEALAHGLPVVASAVGGVPEALGDVGGAHPGMLVRPDDPDALATALRRWLTDDALRRWLRGVATERRATLPTWAATAEAVAAVVGELR